MHTLSGDSPAASWEKQGTEKGVEIVLAPCNAKCFFYTLDFLDIYIIIVIFLTNFEQ